MKTLEKRPSPSLNQNSLELSLLAELSLNQSRPEGLLHHRLPAAPSAFLRAWSAAGLQICVSGELPDGADDAAPGKMGCAGLAPGLEAELGPMRYFTLGSPETKKGSCASRVRSGACHAGGGSGSEPRKGRNPQRAPSKATDPSGRLNLPLAGELENQAAHVSTLLLFGREAGERGGQAGTPPSH